MSARLVAPEETRDTIADTDPRQAEYQFTCPDCRALPNRPCRSWTTGAALHTAHRARYDLLADD